MGLFWCHVPTRRVSSAHLDAVRVTASVAGAVGAAAGAPRGLQGTPPCGSQDADRPRPALPRPGHTQELQVSVVDTYACHDDGAAQPPHLTSSWRSRSAVCSCPAAAEPLLQHTPALTHTASQTLCRLPVCASVTPFTPNPPHTNTLGRSCPSWPSLTTPTSCAAMAATCRAAPAPSLSQSCVSAASTRWVGGGYTGCGWVGGGVTRGVATRRQPTQVQGHAGCSSAAIGFKRLRTVTCQ